MDTESLLKMAYETIINADEDKAMEVIEFACKNNLDLLFLLENGFGMGHKAVADLFDRGKISLPELIFSSEAMKSAVKRVETETGVKAMKQKGSAVIATVEGDVHDIGKLIVGSTMMTYGIQVFDLGRDIPVSMIIESAEGHNADIIITSALLTTTLVEQQKLEDELKRRMLRNKYITMVGGGPCTARWAQKIGADAYTFDAISCAKKAIMLIENKKIKTHKKSDFTKHFKGGL